MILITGNPQRCTDKFLSSVIKILFFTCNLNYGVIIQLKERDVQANCS